MPLLHNVITHTSRNHLIAILELLADLVHKLFNRQRVWVLVLLVVIRILSLPVQISADGGRCDLHYAYIGVFQLGSGNAVSFS